MEKQLEFVLSCGNRGILVAASHLINSVHWSGELWYFEKEEDILDNEVIINNVAALKYPIPSSIGDGALLMDSEVKVLVTTDSGWLSVYSLSPRDEFDNDDSALSSNLVLNNDISRAEHDHSILSVSVCGQNKSSQKAVTGGMDCSIIVWDIETFVPEIIFDAAHVHHVTCVRFCGCDEAKDVQNVGNELFASASLDGYCLLWDKRQKFPATVLHRYKNSGLTSVEWLTNSSNELILGCEDGFLMSMDSRNPKKPVYSSSFFHESVNRICSHLYDSQKFIAVSADCRMLKVIRCEAESFVEVYSNNNHNDYVRGLAWVDKKNELLSCAWDSKLKKHFPFRRLARSERNPEHMTSSQFSFQQNPLKCTTHYFEIDFSPIKRKK